MRAGSEYSGGPKQRLEMEPGQSPAASLMMKLRRRDALSAEEERLIDDLIPAPGIVPAGADIVREHDRPTTSSLLVRGFAARYKVLDSGARQITAVHVPGDFVDLHSFLLRTMDHGVLALTRCEVSRVGHDQLRRVTDLQPHLTRLFWLLTLIDAAIHREWLVGMGRRNARGHMANFFCEMYSLLEVVHLAPDGQFLLPITQNDLGDILGLSSAHVNRVLQELRALELIEYSGGRLSILDWTRLRDIAEFDDTYLQLKPEPR